MRLVLKCGQGIKVGSQIPRKIATKDMLFPVNEYRSSPEGCYGDST